MKIPNPAHLLSLGRAVVAANRPEIMYGASIVSTVSGVILAARGGYKSGYTVAEEDVKRQVVGQEKLNFKEAGKLTWINYLPAAGATLASVGSTTGLHLVHVKEKKQLATAALIAIDQVKKDGEQIKKELLESVGLAKSEDPKDLQKAAGTGGVAKVKNADGVIDEVFLVRDKKTGRDIWTNKHRISDAVSQINIRLGSDDDVTLNDFYELAGFEKVEDGQEMGWPARQLVGAVWDEEVVVRADGRPVRQFRLDPPAASEFDPTPG